MTRRLASAAFLLYALAALSSCAAEDLSTPPEPRVGRHECADCGMLISEDRCAAAYLVNQDGVSSFVLFDDIGCLIVFEAADDADAKLLQPFVRDYDTNTWIDARTASFLLASPDVLSTPMASGVVAFSTQAQAIQAQVHYGGSIGQLSDLRSAHRQRGIFNHPSSPTPIQLDPSSSQPALHPESSPQSLASTQPLNPGPHLADAYYRDTCAACDRLLGAAGLAIDFVSDDRHLRFCREACRLDFLRRGPDAVARLDRALVLDQSAYYPLDVCIIAGEPLDHLSIDVIWCNRLFRLCSESHRSTLLAQPQHWLEVLDNAVIAAQKDTYPLPNTCPIQGDILDSDTPCDVVVANRMIRVCCSRCAKLVINRPSQYLSMIDYAHRAAAEPPAGEPHAE